MGNCLWKKGNYQESINFLKDGLNIEKTIEGLRYLSCLLYTSPSPRD